MWSLTDNQSMQAEGFIHKAVIHGIVSREGFQRKNVLDHSVAGGGARINSCLVWCKFQGNISEANAWNDCIWFEVEK